MTMWPNCAHRALTQAGLFDGDEDTVVALSGIGFHLVVDRGTCPSSPTAYDWSTVHTRAAERLGVESSCFECHRGEEDAFPASRDEAVKAVKESLDRGVRPVTRSYEWQEFACVTAYDDEDEVLVVDPPADPILYTNLGRVHGYPMLFVQTFGSAIDTNDAVRDALHYAKTCWTGDGFPRSPVYPHYAVGKAGYETLIEAIERGDSDPLGLRFILRILSEARAAVARWMLRLDDKHLRDATKHYSEVAAFTARAAELLPNKEPWDAPLDRAVLPEAAAALRHAAAAEGRAVEAL